MPDGIAISCPKRTISRYGVKLSGESTSHGITLSRRDVLEASHTRRASPLLAGCPLESLPARAIQLPDKEFRYLRQFYPSCRHEDWTISSSGGMSDVWPLRIPASLITGLSC